MKTIQLKERYIASVKTRWEMLHWNRSLTWKQINVKQECQVSTNNWIATKTSAWRMNNLFRCLPPSTMTLLFLLKKVSLIRRSENYTKNASSPFVVRKYKIFTCALQFWLRTVILFWSYDGKSFRYFSSGSRCLLSGAVPW